MSVSSVGRSASRPIFSQAEFRVALGTFATGVTIVSARSADGKLIGLTANSFNSLSLNPPLVLWSLAREARSMPIFSTISHYAINVLTVEQQELAQRFATKGADRWTGVSHTEGVAGTPLLTSTAATFECFNRRRYDEGDHVIFVGEVERFTCRTKVAPLLFVGGRFHTELRF